MESTEIAEIEHSSPTEAPIFLLSPALLSGERARQLTASGARFALAERLREPAGAPIGEVFAFLSSLYFRGKLAYARRFAMSEGLPDEPGLWPGIWIIAPGYGLVPPDWALTPERLGRLRRTPVDPAVRAYRRPLAEQAAAVAARLGPVGRAVLLGSVATGKYVDVLAPVFGARLHYPATFAGRGDMSRGSLLLRAAAAGEELAYTPLTGTVPPVGRRQSAARREDAA